MGIEKTRRNVLETVAHNRDRLRGLGVSKLGLFGSTARDGATDKSDLDFIVEFHRKSFDAYMEVKLLLEDLFSCKGDLVLTDAIKPALRQPIRNAVIYVPGLCRLS